jgi:hypothetical protein
MAYLAWSTKAVVQLLAIIPEVFYNTYHMFESTVGDGKEE